MISAPERTTEPTEPARTAETTRPTFARTHSQSYIQTRGHLALVHWATSDTKPTIAPNIAVKPQFLKDPVCKSATDRWFERSVFLLMASSVAAISACFMHL